LGLLVALALLSAMVIASNAQATEDVVWGTEGHLMSYEGETEIREPNGAVILQKAGEDLFYGGGEAVGGVIQMETVKTGVELKGQLCSSEGASLGEVVWNKISATVGIVKGTTVGIAYAPQTTGGLLASFTCGTSTVEIRGGLVGTIGPVNQLIGFGEFLTATYAAKKPGVQEYTKLKGGPKDELEISINKGKFRKAALVGTDRIEPASGQSTEITETKVK
jgi:hypothetical protein